MEAPMAARDRRLAPRTLAIGAVLLLHVALIGWLQHAWHRADSHREQRSSSIRMVTIQLPPLPDTRSAPAPRPPQVARRASPDPRRVPQAPVPEAEEPHEERRPAVVMTAPAAASAASGPSGRDLLYGAATQRAIRQGTQGQPLLSERADTASLAPDKIDASTKLGNEMMKGATGDCLKGEFAGAGAGLLSVPFWLLAEARGKCRR
jgi:type IV secretory pathway VirB10-like protein